MALQIWGSVISCPLYKKLASDVIINIFVVNDIGQGAMQAKRSCSTPNQRLSKLELVAQQGLRRKQSEDRIARRQALFQVFQPGTVAASIRGCAAH
jgi:hypothetical protein